MTNVIAIYDTDDQYSRIDDADECTECHGEFIAVEEGSSCPACGGAPPEELLDRYLARLQGEVRPQVLALAKRIDEYESSAVMLEQHARDLTARAAVLRRRVAGVKRFMQLQMEAANIANVKDAYVTVYLQDNPASFEIVDEASVPDRHKRATLRMPAADVPPDMRDLIVSTDILKLDLKAHLEETGEIPPGCEYHEKGHTRHLRVRR